MPRPRKDATAPRPSWAAALMARRLQLGLSQEAVAGKTRDAIAQRTISHLETGKTPLTELTLTRVAALARALEWTLFDLQDATGLDLNIGQNPASTVQTVAVHTIPSYPMAAALNPDLPPHQHSVMLGARRDGRPHPQTLRAYIMDSDEMVVSGQRSLHPGDYVVVNVEDQELDSGVMYLVTRNGKAHVRRYKETEIGNGFYADNVSYDPIPTHGTTVIGRVYRLGTPDRTPDRTPPTMN